MSEPDPVTPDTPPPSPPATSDDGYAPPPDLPEEEEEAKCETDVTITIKEPNVTGRASNSHSGTSWIGVDEVEVTLRGGGKILTATTSGGGVARFSKVACGAYIVSMSQDEFKMYPLNNMTFNVSATRKSGREKEMKIRRQLLTVEMFRLPTHLWESIRTGAGKDPSDAITTDPYGHHWFKMYASVPDQWAENPQYSYGWWPKYGVGATDLWDGVPGSLNGVPTYSSSRDKDPYHTKYNRDDSRLEDVFFPFVTNGKTAAEYKDELRAKSKSYETDVSNLWSWRTDGAGYHCKTFQAHVMRETNVWKRLGVGIGAFGWSVNV